MLRALRLLLAAAATLPAAVASAAPPNLLLLVAEDMGPRVAAFGDPVAVTPHLDALAAEGIRYPNTFTAAGVCAPSRAALVSGVHPIAIGAMHMRTSDRGYRAVPPPEVKAFPELLRAAGYWTFTDEKLDYAFSGIRAGTGPFTIWDAEGLTAGWEDRPEGAPFFGLLNFQITHESALFPRPAWPRSAMHALFQVLYAWQLWGHPDVVAPESVVLPAYYPDVPAVRSDLARHYNHVHRMDEQVGEILARLERDGLADETVVVFTSDHGDGLPRAKREIFDSGIRVPLIVRWPERVRPAGATPAGATPGSVDARLVSFVDLAPTLLAVAGVARPAFLAGRVFAGPGAEAPRRYVFAAKDRMDEVPDRQRAVRDARWKYVRTLRPGTPGAAHLAFRDHLASMRALWELHEAGALRGAPALWFAPRPAEALYDTRQDPDEVRDLAADPAHAATLARMRGALDAFLAETGDLGAVPEAELAERFWPGGAAPVTAPPAIGSEPRSEGALRVTLRSPTEGASKGYRIDGGPWRLYVGAVALAPGARIEAKAVRYGWEESEVVALRAAPDG